MEKGNHSLKTHTPEPVSPSSTSALKAEPVTDAHSPAPLTEDQTPRGSLGYGTDKSEFTQDPITNIDETKKEFGGPFPDQFEKNGAATSSAPNWKALGKEGKEKEKVVEMVDEGNKTVKPDTKDDDTQVTPETAGLTKTPGTVAGLSYASVVKEPAPIVPKKEPGPGTSEVSGLSNMEIGNGDFGYNVGKGDDPGEEAGENPEAARRRQSLGLKEPQHGVKSRNPMVGKGQDSSISSGTNDLANIGLESGDFGYNVGEGNDPGEEAGENPVAAKTRQSFGQKEPQHAAKSTRTPETRKPERSGEANDLSNMDIGSDDFGYNVGRGEEGGHIRPDGDSTENPGSSRARIRASMQSGGDGERLNLKRGNSGKRRCSGSDFGIDPPVSELRSESHRAYIPSFEESLSRTNKDTATNDTLQSYLQSFLSERGSNPTGTVSECPKIHSSQAMEGATNQKMSNRDRQILEYEDRHRAIVGQQQMPSPSMIGSSGTPVTLEQLQQVLSEFKRDILDSIDHPPSSGSTNISQLGTRLGKMETDIDFIRKQISPSNGIVTNGIIHPEELMNGSAGHSSVKRRFTDTGFYGWGGDGRKISWATIGLGLLTALCLVALGSILGGAARHERGLGDRVAEWLFMEGSGRYPRAG